MKSDTTHTYVQGDLFKNNFEEVNYNHSSKPEPNNQYFQSDFYLYDYSFDYSYHYLEVEKKPITTNKTGDTEVFITQNTFNLPRFFRGYDSIKVPKKTRAALNHIGKKNLRNIHEDTETAKELCLIFLSNLTDTYFRMNAIGFNPDSNEQQGWKSLSSKILRDQYKAPCTYKKIITVLEQGTPDKGPIIECDRCAISDSKCYSYRLAEPYRCKGVEHYQIQTQYVKQLQHDNIIAAIEESTEHPICKALLQLYPQLTIPSLDEVEAIGRSLAKNKHKTKKSKTMTVQGKKAKTSWKTPEERSFLEDHLDIFDYLFSSGLMVPHESGPAAGGRVVDSLVLMPSWQRDLLLIDGEPITEVDYSCLHPNIAMKLYNGNSRYITHSAVAENLRAPRDKIKIEHLSFFNKKYDDMKRSLLWNYYSSFETDMLAEVVRQKADSVYGHKVTSRELFKKETEIMTDVVLELMGYGVPVGYIYDALFCKEADREIVKDTMNKIILEHGVYTTAK